MYLVQGATCTSLVPLMIKDFVVGLHKAALGDLMRSWCAGSGCGCGCGCGVLGRPQWREPEPASVCVCVHADMFVRVNAFVCIHVCGLLHMLAPAFKSGWGMAARESSILCTMPMSTCCAFGRIFRTTKLSTAFLPLRVLPCQCLSIVIRTTVADHGPCMVHIQHGSMR